MRVWCRRGVNKPSVCRSQEPCLLAAAFLLMGAATAALTLVQQTG
jgi:hypothetical protein